MTPLIDVDLRRACLLLGKREHALRRELSLLQEMRELGLDKVADKRELSDLLHESILRTREKAPEDEDIELMEQLRDKLEELELLLARKLNRRWGRSDIREVGL